MLYMYATPFIGGIAGRNAPYRFAVRERALFKNAFRTARRGRCVRPRLTHRPIRARTRARTDPLFPRAIGSHARMVAEPTSLLELQPSVEWDAAQHSLMEASEPFYIQRATGVRGDVKVADDLYCGALTNPDGDIFCSGDLCAARIRPLHSPGRLEARTPSPPTPATSGATMAT